MWNNVCAKQCHALVFPVVRSPGHRFQRRVPGKRATETMIVTEIAASRETMLAVITAGGGGSSPSCATMYYLRTEGRSNRMLRKAVSQVLVLALLAFMALNAYLSVNHLRGIQRTGALALESSTIAANISGVLKDLTDMETGQRGYLLTENPAYLQPYTDGKTSIETHLAGLRSGLAARGENERSLESQLESLAKSKQAEMERTIGLRKQGYRRRAFMLVDTNEGKDYMDGARRILSSLAATESSRAALLESERKVALSRAFSETMVANSCLLVLTACLFGLIRYREKMLEQAAVQGKGKLSICESQLEKLTSALSRPTRSVITAIEAAARLLLENYGGFLPRQGHEYAEQIIEAAAQMERLRQELLSSLGPNRVEEAA
jgi:CHASE3 domain sensor protein